MNVESLLRLKIFSPGDSVTIYNCFSGLIGNTSLVWDHKWKSYGLEQPEMPQSNDYKHKCHA